MTRKVVDTRRRFQSEELALVNTMDRELDPLAVATAALVHAAMTRRPTPDYHGALSAARQAEVVLTALYRRGMLVVP
jgi:hypothetical protein